MAPVRHMAPRPSTKAACTRPWAAQPAASNCSISGTLGCSCSRSTATTRVGALRRVLISNITAHNSNARLSSIVSGIPGYAIEDVKMTNIFLDHTGGGDAAAAAIAVPEDESKYPEPGMFGPMPANGFFFRHMRGLEVSHTEIRPLAGDARPAFQLEDVTRADFFAERQQARYRGGGGRCC